MRNTGLEAVRGLAAVMVLFNHIHHIPAAKASVGQWIMLLNWGTEAVVIFFLLSGVVIRLSTDQKPRAAGPFLWTRAKRLLPLYLVAVGFAVVVLWAAGRAPSAWCVTGNLLFLQSLGGHIAPVLEANDPLWSLSLEAFFYLAFALTIGRRQRVLLLVWALAAAAALGSQLFGTAGGWLGHLQLATAYSSIWLLGYVTVDLAARVRIGTAAGFAWLGLLPMAARVSVGDEYHLAARHLLVAATAVPLFVVLLRRGRGERDVTAPWTWVAWCGAYAGLAGLLLATSRSLFLSKVVYVIFPVLATGAGAVLARLEPRLGRLVPAALFLGQLSYALYLFHHPVYYSARIVGLSGLGGAAVLVPVAVLVACLAEFYVHPRLSGWMFPTRAKRRQPEPAGAAPGPLGADRGPEPVPCPAPPLTGSGCLLPAESLPRADR